MTYKKVSVIVSALIVTSLIAYLLFSTIDEAITIAHLHSACERLERQDQLSRKALFIFCKKKSKSTIIAELDSSSIKEHVQELDSNTVRVGEIEFKFLEERLTEIRNLNADN